MSCKIKRALSFVLVLALLFQLLPVRVLAVEAVHEDSAEEADWNVPPEEEPDVVGEIEELRDHTVKQFRLSDGSYAAVNYGIPVHYLNDSNQWADVDNTLIYSENAGQYLSANGKEQRGFANMFLTGQPVLVSQYENYSVEMTLLPLNGGEENANVSVFGLENQYSTEGVEAIVINPGDSSLMSNEAEQPLAQQVLPEKMGSYVIYEGVFQGIDLMYENFGYNIKETILVNEHQDCYSFRFLLALDGLNPSLCENGSIILADEAGNVIYNIPAPYMYDAEGAVSYAVSYSLEAVEDDYILTVTADSAWIEDEERVFPVAIDPTISVKCEYVPDGTLYTTHVVQGDPNLEHSGDNEQYIGYGMGYNSNDTGPVRECQIFLHVADLPDIPEGCTMVEATLQMYHYGETGYSYIGACSTLEIAAYPVTSPGPADGDYRSWIEDMTWNTRPAFDTDALIDFAVASDATEGSYIRWDLTEQVEKWYEDQTENRTLALTGYESGSYNSGYCAVAVLKGYGTTNPPALIVNYRSAIGLEPYYSAQTQGIGFAGTGYVGDYNGQLVLIKNVAAHSSVVMPFALNLVYNSYYADGRFQEARNTGMNFGNGWKLDAIQTLSACTGDLNNYMLYIDGDGTYHYFKKNGNKWDDEDGLDMTITSTAITDTSGDSIGNGYAIKNGQDSKLLFYNGLLVQQEDANGNKICFLYNGAMNAQGSGWLPTGSGDQLTKVVQRNKGTTEDITLAVLTYNERGYLTAVTDRAETQCGLSYDAGDNLIRVSSDDWYDAVYTYEGGYLNEAVDNTNLYKIDYDFADSRVSRICEKAGSFWEDGSSIAVYGSRDKTVYQYSGADGLITDLETASAGELANSDDLLTTYLFDDEGRTINSNTTSADRSVLYGASTGAYASSSGTSNTNNHLMNSATIGTATINLIQNGSFETAGSATDTALGWTYEKSDTSGVNIVMRNDGHRTGNYALKTWISNTRTSGTLRAYQTVQNLVAEKTYTFSAYVNTTQVSQFTENGGVYLKVTGGGSGESDWVNYVTASAMDSGWTRISVTFVATGPAATLNIYVVNAIGTVYVDDTQLEQDDAPGSINLVTNGTLESTDGWDVRTTNISVYEEIGMGGSNAVGIDSNPNISGYMFQSIPVNLPYTETYVLSGWAKADALPNNQPVLTSVKLFCLKAEVYYSNGTKEDFYLPFSAEIDGEWQYASRVIVPSKQYTVTKILVYCAYHYNIGTALFDNVSLVREPAQTMKYDENGYLVSVATPNVAADTNTYANGDLTKVVTSGSGTFNYTYDDYHNVKSATNGLITQNYTYDSSGNVVSSSLSGKNYTKKITSSVTYTADGNQVATTTDARGKTTTNVYETDWNLTYGLPRSVTDLRETTVTYDYNDDGTVSYQEIDGLVSLTYEYTRGNLTKVTRMGRNSSVSTGELGNSQVYSLSYNAFGQVTHIYVGEDYANRRLLTWNFYNDDGSLQGTITGNGFLTIHTYDDLGRVISSSSSNHADEDPRVVTYAYTADGSLGEVKMDSGLSYRYMYDSLGRLISSSRHDGGVLKLETRQEYDTSNRLSKQYLSLVDTTYSERYNYDNYGRLGSMTAGDGQTITLSYDPLSRLATVTGPVAKVTYGYANGANSGETTGLVSSMAYTAAGGSGLSELTFGYSYDNAGNIIEIQDPISGKTITYTYDAQGQLLSETIDGATTQYYYDSVGNRIDNTDPEHPLYIYGDDVWHDLLTAYDGEDIIYDEIGNPESYYNGTRWTFDWDNGRELSTASDGTTSITFAYDMNGIRTNKTVGTTSHNYIYAGGKLIRETIGTDTTLDFLYDQNGKPYAMMYDGEPYYYITNLQGDVVRLVDEDGVAVATYQYNAWGEVTVTPGSVANAAIIANANPLRYRGYYYDSESGFYYLQSRYYDPTIGRFINADQFTSTGQDFAGYNMFAYCGNNPVSRKDDGGEFWETVIDVVSLCASVAEVMANPSDPWAWAGLVGDAVDLLPFVTGVGEVTKVAKISINAIQSSDDVVQAARRLYNAAGDASGLRKATGSYEILFESGRNYAGKGGFYRSTVSANFRSSLNNDRVLSITWTPAQSSSDAYIAEYFLMKVNGVNNDNTYNAIWSPGRKLMESVWNSVFGG